MEKYQQNRFLGIWYIWQADDIVMFQKLYICHITWIRGKPNQECMEAVEKYNIIFSGAAQIFEC